MPIRVDKHNTNAWVKDKLADMGALNALDVKRHGKLIFQGWKENRQSYNFFRRPTESVFTTLCAVHRQLVRCPFEFILYRLPITTS